VIRQLPRWTKKLTATSTNEVCEPVTDWFNTLECLSLLQALLVLAGKGGMFQCRLGIQTAAATPDEEDAPQAFGTDPYDDQVTAAATPKHYRLDPNGASDGNIDTKMWFRLVIWYSLASGSTSASGTPYIDGISWR
jgi:hypothetical protein